MKKCLTLILLVTVFVFSVGVVLAARPDSQLVNVEPSNEHATVTIPAHAKEVSPGVFYLGAVVDNGRLVEGYAMFAKPGTECGNGICEPGENARKCPEDCANGEDPEDPDTSSCYTFLSKGAKWKTIEPYLVDATNTRGLDKAFVASNVASDISKWETAVGVDILGDEIAGIVDGADLESPDNKNELYFADVDYEGAIAIAIVWGYFRGPPSARELVEWDMIFDDVDFDWSASGETGKMDFENIATHELGHAVGLGDLYNTVCAEETMYGYSDYGETKKRDLNAGDIIGIQELYGL